jgi:hypothetical protein
MTIEELLSGKCIFCGYSGNGYYQANTHHENCPWRNVAGLDERIKNFPNVIKHLYNNFEAKDNQNKISCMMCNDDSIYHFCEICYEKVIKFETSVL